MTNLNNKHKVLSSFIAGIARNSFFMLLLCLLYGCDNPAVYDFFQPVEKATWEKSKTFYFTFDIKDKEVPYDLTVELRNNSLYPYRNIWIICKEELPVGPLQKDTMEYMLADEFGKWTGKGFSLFSNSFPVKKAYYFPYTGRYTFSFTHNMTDDQLKGIHEIGFRVEKTETSQPLAPGSIEPDKDKKQDSKSPQ